MKTLGRVFIILVAFAIVMGITYVVVNAEGSALDGAPQFTKGERPEVPGGNLDGRREGGERGGGGWMFGFIKNVGIIGMVTVLIALPRSWMRVRKRAVPAAAE